MQFSKSFDHPVLKALPAQLFFFKCFNRLTKVFVKRVRVRTKSGFDIVCEPTDLIQSTIYHFGIWEPDVSSVVERLLRPGDVVADVGANIGYDALLASTLVGASGAVVAIEAEPRTFSKLRENISINPGAMNIRAVNLAASDENGSLTIFSGNNKNIGSASIHAAKERQTAVSVQAMPLDEILSDDERRRLRLIKIDIEGSEPAVLGRLLKTLDLYSSRLCVIVEADPENDPVAWQNIFANFSDAGFSGYSIENSYSPVWYLNWREPRPLEKIDRSPIVKTDILFVRGEAPQP